MKETIQKVAVYVRLSQEDRLEDVSNSIKNQIELAKEYCNNHNLTIKEIYQDDGYTGSNFDRPDFKRLIEDIKMNKINVVITKDLSRLGRNLLGSGYYLEDFFPTYNVRYISINDNYDSFLATNEDTLVLKNFVNELYVKECIKKSKLQVERRKKTKIMSTGSYGYIRKGEKLVIDPNTAPIVKEIFERFSKGESVINIKNDLIQRKIIAPAYYKKQLTNYKRENLEPYGWKSISIYDILSKREYTGDSHNHKSKYKKINKTDSFIIENTHEAIISRELFEKCQEIKAKRQRISNVDDSKRLKGFYFHNNVPLRYELAKNKKSYEYYSNSNIGLYVRLDFLHKVTYQYCYDMFLKLNDEKVISEFEKEYNVDLLLHQKAEIEKEEKKLQAKYQDLFEAKIKGEIKETDYQLQKDILDNKIAYNDELHNQVIMDIYYNKEKATTFHRIIEELKDIDSTKDKLEFIRAVASSCDVDKIDDKYKLNIKFKFQI